MSFGVDDPGMMAVTIVHGLEFVLGAIGQPMIGALWRSPSHRTAPPWIIIRPGRLMMVTLPPWMHWITALVVSTGGIAGRCYRAWPALRDAVARASRPDLARGHCHADVGHQHTACVLFGAYSALLACALLVDQLWWGGFVLWHPHGALVLAALWCLTRPRSVARFLVMVATTVVVLALDLPQVGDHLLLVLVTGVGVLGWWAGRLRRRRPIDATALWAALAPFLRAQVVLLYVAAALAKLNTGFLDPAVSCAAGMSRQIAWLDPSLLDGNGRALAAIYATLAIEASLPVLLLVRRTRPAGLALGAAFHAVLALAGNVPFSALVLALYVAFLPEATPARLRALAIRRPRLGAAAHALQRGARSRLAVPAGIAAWLAGSASSVGPGAYGGPVGGAARLAVLGGILVAAGVLLAAFAPAARAGLHRRLAPAHVRLHPVFAAGLLLLVLNAASPYLGLKTEASFTMFSNLQTEPGHWNHVFLPEDLRIFGAQDDLVRVTDSADPRLERRARDNTLMVRFELERYLRANPRSSAWVLPATAPPGAAPQPMRAAGLPRAPLLDHLVNFADVRPGGRGRC